MYHTNFGGGHNQTKGEGKGEGEEENDGSAWAGGLLGAGSRMVAATKSITPFTDHAAGAVGNAEVYTGPINGFSEEVFKRVPLSDGHGKASATLINPLGDRGVTMSWPTDQMPCLTQVRARVGVRVGREKG